MKVLRKVIKMAELRYNSLIGDYVMIASHRQERPQMPKDYCPFCPGSGKVPDDYTVFAYDNDFPALSQNPIEPDDVDNGLLFQAKHAYGKCEVILYSKDHNATLCDLSVEHITELVNLWQVRISDLSKDSKIKYIMPFENKGEIVGVTMPHPHGQIYGYSWIPLRVQKKIDIATSYYREHKKSIFDDMLLQEQNDGRRIIFENGHFVCLLPFATEYPYGVMIMSKEHIPSIVGFNKEQSISLASMLKETTGMLDALFNIRFPYMMALYSAPINGEDLSKEWNFHIEFFPPLRSKDRQKFNASSETAAWAACNPTAPEEKAIELRDAYKKFKASGN